MTLNEKYPSVDFRRWRFLEARDADETTVAIFDEFGPTFLKHRSAHILRNGKPPDGGIMTEPKSVVIPDGTKFVCFTYRGDFAFCEQAIDAFGASSSRRVASIQGESFVISDGTVVSANDCRLVDDVAA